MTMVETLPKLGIRTKHKYHLHHKKIKIKNLGKKYFTKEFKNENYIEHEHKNYTW